MTALNKAKVEQCTLPLNNHHKDSFEKYVYICSAKKAALKLVLKLESVNSWCHQDKNVFFAKVFNVISESKSNHYEVTVPPNFSPQFERLTGLF